MKTIGMNHGVDKIGIVEGGRGSIECLFVEAPCRGPLLRWPLGMDEASEQLRPRSRARGPSKACDGSSGVFFSVSPVQPLQLPHEVCKWEAPTTPRQELLHGAASAHHFMRNPSEPCRDVLTSLAPPEAHSLPTSP